MLEEIPYRHFMVALHQLLLIFFKHQAWKQRETAQLCSQALRLRISLNLIISAAKTLAPP